MLTVCQLMVVVVMWSHYMPRHNMSNFQNYFCLTAYTWLHSRTKTNPKFINQDWIPWFLFLFYTFIIYFSEASVNLTISIVCFVKNGQNCVIFNGYLVLTNSAELAFPALITTAFSGGSAVPISTMPWAFRCQYLGRKSCSFAFFWD